MAVSADTLFHFTSKESLKGILRTGGFWPTYSKEHFNQIFLADSPFTISHIPMISFCDLRLTQLSNPSISLHTKDFGKYGIGFHKFWGTSNKISPVVYVHKNSTTSNLISDLIKKVRTLEKSDKSSGPENINVTLTEFIKFIKPYDGHYQKGNWKKKIRRYYDEREWRFVPRGDKSLIVYPNTEFPKELERKLNSSLRKHPLRFSADDIKYLIIERDSDKLEFAEAVNSRSNLSKSQKTDIITKIISFEEIESDY